MKNQVKHPSATRNLKTVLLTAIMLCASFAFAQGPPGERHREKREEIARQKVAFITQEVDLTVEEAQVFWPVYNAHEKKMNALRKAHREDRRKFKENMESLSDKEKEAHVDNEIAFQQKELDLRKEFHAQLKGVLPIDKVLRFYRAQESFKKQLLKELRGHREQRDGERHQGRHHGPH